MTLYSVQRPPISTIHVFIFSGRSNIVNCLERIYCFRLHSRITTAEYIHGYVICETEELKNQRCCCFNKKFSFTFPHHFRQYCSSTIQLNSCEIQEGLKEVSRRKGYLCTEVKSQISASFQVLQSPQNSGLALDFQIPISSLLLLFYG